MPARALALPDGRGYEMVTPLDKNAQEVGAGTAGTDVNAGNTVNWEAIGGCCGATSAASTLYQSTRSTSGWTTTPKTPTPRTPLVGLFEEQQPMWWSPDLSKTVYLTPSSYTMPPTLDARPPGPGETAFFDLYEQDASGALTWLTGPFPTATDTQQYNATWAATTPDGNSTLFSSQEQLTSDASSLGNLAGLNTPAEYVYDHNIATGTTSLVDVTTTTLAAKASGPVSTSLTANSVGTTPTSLTALAGPAVNDNLTAKATGPHATMLTQPATGNVSTTLTANTLAGATDLPVVSSAGFAIGQTITVSVGATAEETTRVTGIPASGTDITVSPLANPHSTGDSVNYGGDTVLAVASTTGLAQNQVITIDTGGSQEAATIASVPNGTQIDLMNGLSLSHSSGAAVSYQGDTSIVVNDTSKLETGETITIDGGSSSQETATITGVNGSQLLLSAPLKFDHSSGAPVTYPGDSTLAVANSGNFAGGQTITIDAGQPNQETATIASVPDGTHLALTASLGNPHASGAAVQHASPDSSIAVSSTTGFAAPQTITIGTGASAETATVSAVTDSTHLALSAPLTKNHSSGDPVSYAGDKMISVASTSLFTTGQDATIGSGSSQETDMITGVSGNQLQLSTPLVNNHAQGAQVEELISPDGAIAGNGNFLNEPSIPANDSGTTTNSVSSDGTKVFFESPGTCTGGSCSAEGVGPPHLYMRDLATNSTTPLDNPSSGGQAVYEGASQDGSLVFFSSNEGLGGASSDNELYEFNTTGSQIGPAPAMSAIPISDGGNPSTAGNVEGITAVSNNGHYVYFIAKGVLVPLTTTGADGTTPTAGNQNFYVFNTTTGTTTFIATLGSGIPGDSRDKNNLAREPDTSRAAIPTPDGSVLVFESTANLKDQNPPGPTTTLTAATSSGGGGSVSIPVASSAGFLVGRSVEFESSFFSESATVMGIPDSTHLLVDDSGIGLIFPHSSGDQVVQRPPFEIYRYTVPASSASSPASSIVCVSCTPTGVVATGSAGLGASGGGSYGPPGQGVPMSSDGTRIFFDSPDPLVHGVIGSPPIPLGLFGALEFVTNVYEWEANGTGSCTQSGGCVNVISDGRSTLGSALGSTTPTGNDVFFTTQDELAPQDTDGYDDIYDARVGGGFAAPPPSAPACGSASSCRPSVTPTVFFSAPSSATLVEPNGVSPSFSVNSISAKQRKRFANTGVLTLTVNVSQAGRIVAVASDPVRRVRVTVATASHSFFATDGGTATLTLRLSQAARRKLAKQHRLSLVITVSYSESSEVSMASLTLTTGKTEKATTRQKATTRRGAITRRATVRRGARER